MASLEFAILPVPTSPGVGADTDVEDLREVKTFVLDGPAINLNITIEGRINTGGNYAPVATMTRNQGAGTAPPDTKQVTWAGREMRVRTNTIQSGSPTLEVTADDA